MRDYTAANEQQSSSDAIHYAHRLRRDERPRHGKSTISLANCIRRVSLVVNNSQVKWVYAIYKV